jgi:biotin-(acetyl-CoA carboxylase) ligase
VKRYEEVIGSTAIIVKSKFKEWYKIGTDNVITVAESQRHTKGDHYFVWVTESLKEIMGKRRLLEVRNGSLSEMSNILKKSPEMNKLINTLLPKGEAQKFHFDERRVKEIISEFQAVQTSITNHLVRKTSSSGEEQM